MGSQAKLVLIATRAGEYGISPGLLDVAGLPLATHFLRSIRPCTRLLPVTQKVYILTSSQTHDHYLAWASNREHTLGGFPHSNLIRVPDSALYDDLEALAYAACTIPGAMDAYTIVASLEHFHGTEVPFQQLLEHTVIRGKDTVVVCIPPPGHSLEGQSEVVFDVQGSTTVTGAWANPRVAEIELQPAGCADGISTSVLTSITLLHKTSLPILISAAEQKLYPGGPQQIAAFIKGSLLGQGKPVYSLQVDFSLECSSANGMDYVASLVGFMQEEASKKEKLGQAAEALSVIRLRAQDTGILSRGDKELEDLLETSSETKRLLLKHSALVGGQDTRQGMGAAGGSAAQARTQYGVWETIPERFLDASTRRHTSKLEHPVYLTTANDIGRKPPTQMEMPDVYAGSTGAFSKTFAGPYKTCGLNTHYTTSKVHKKLDDY